MIQIDHGTVRCQVATHAKIRTKNPLSLISKSPNLHTFHTSKPSNSIIVNSFTHPPAPSSPAVQNRFKQHRMSADLRQISWIPVRRWGVIRSNLQYCVNAHLIWMRTVTVFEKTKVNVNFEFRFVDRRGCWQITTFPTMTVNYLGYWVYGHAGPGPPSFTGVK